MRPNVWQHVVVTRSTATRTIAFYVNGVAKGAGTNLILPTTGTSPVSIGRARSGAQWVNGRLDEVAIYPVALTAAQQAAHYQLSSVPSQPSFVALPLLAVDPDLDVLTYSATGLPTGLTIDGATGLISGQLTTASAGVHQVTATASDGALWHSQTFPWTVTEVNQAPIVASLAPQASAEGAHISLPVSAIDPDGDSLSYDASGLPPSLTIDAATGLIQGNAPDASAGAYTVVVTVSDGRLSGAQTFTWAVANTDRSPVLANPRAQTVRLIASYPLGCERRGALCTGAWMKRPARWPWTPSAAVTGISWAACSSASPVPWPDGTSAMLFNGSNAYIQVPSSAALPLAGDLTLELWVKVASLATRQTLISKDSSPRIRADAGDQRRAEPVSRQRGGLWQVWSPAAGAVTTNSWQHVVVTRTAATNTIRLLRQRRRAGRWHEYHPADHGHDTCFDWPGQERRAVGEWPARRGGDLPCCPHCRPSACALRDRHVTGHQRDHAAIYRRICMAIGIVCRRWLAAGPHDERHLWAHLWNAHRKQHGYV